MSTPVQVNPVTVTNDINTRGAAYLDWPMPLDWPWPECIIEPSCAGLDGA
jgi:hypothetical protein